MNAPNLHVDWDGIRAGNTLRWLSQSGPLYENVEFVFSHIGPDQAVHGRLLDGQSSVQFPQRFLSYASWRMWFDAVPGECLILKLRTK